MSTLQRPDPQTATDAQLHGYEAAQAVFTAARKLRALADDLEERAVLLTRGNGLAVGCAGEIVNDYVQGVGSIGGFVSSVVDAAGRADAASRSTDTPT